MSSWLRQAMLGRLKLEVPVGPLLVCLLTGWPAFVPCCRAQPRPYIGYVYPAGGQQGTTVPIRLGGQNLDEVQAVLISGTGATGRVVEYHRRLNNQEVQLLNEQLRELKRATNGPALASSPMWAADPAMIMGQTTGRASAATSPELSLPELMAKIEQRTRGFVQIPACASLASLVFAEVTLAADAEPGERELRLVTLRGVSNPLSFHVGQWPEYCRPPMPISPKQILGREEQALRQRPTNEIEVALSLPCTVNGQIASGEVNRYRFQARKGQQLVCWTLARQLVPYIADAVPGWVQPVLTLYDARGRELAFADDFRFKPDPVLRFVVPEDGQYVLEITDALYRGREDFVYRLTLGELPFVTSLFPLGARVGTAVSPRMRGWNLKDAVLAQPAADAPPGIYLLSARRGDQVSNPVPFALDELPELLERETNNTPAGAQKLTLPVIVNGRIDRQDDWDVFEFTANSNDLLAVEVQARRLDSPLDSVIKLTDAQGRVLAFNDDHEDLAAGLHTHHADSRLLVRLPSAGTYYLHLGDAARQGGPDYGYRLRLSPPRPDFVLVAVPSSLSLRTNSTATLTVYLQRKDGFTGPIRLALQEPPPGFSATPVTLAGTQTVGRLTIRSPATPTPAPVTLTVVGTAQVDGRPLTRQAIPAEDRMQAFLWRHLVPARELKVLVFDPGYQPPPARVAPTLPPAPTNLVAATTLPANVVAGTNAVVGTNTVAAAKPKFTKQQVASRLRQLKLLYEEGLLTDTFYLERVAECQAAE